MRGWTGGLLALTIVLIGSHGTANAAICKPNAADVTVCLNQACDPASLGQTTMDGDKQSIIACLKNASGNTVWKSMHGDGGIKVIGAATGRIELNAYGYRLYKCINPTGVAKCGTIEAIMKGPEDDYGIQEGSTSPFCATDGLGAPIVNPDTGLAAAHDTELYTIKQYFKRMNKGTAVLTTTPPWVVVDEYRMYCLSFD